MPGYIILWIIIPIALNEATTRCIGCRIEIQEQNEKKKQKTTNYS